MVEQITSADFKTKVLEADKPVLVDFFATWCGPCRMMAPVIEEVAADMAGKAYVYQLDIDQNPDITQAMGIMSVPTFATFQGGKVLHSTVGVQPKEQILALFE